MKKGCDTNSALDLAELAADNVALFLDKANHKQIHLHNSVTAGTQVYADAPMVETIFRNLLSNALKFSSSGGQILLPAHPHDHAWVEVAVADTGVGMAPEERSRLFRIDSHYTRVGTGGEHGTGLGLSLCKELVDRHGGRIWVESAVGKGTTFRFTLPRQSAAFAIR